MKRLLLVCLMLLVPAACVQAPRRIEVIPLKVEDEYIVPANFVLPIVGQYTTRIKNPARSKSTSQPISSIPAYIDILSKPLAASVTVLFPRGLWVYGMTAKHVVRHPAYGPMTNIKVQGQDADIVVEGRIHDVAIVRWRPKIGYSYPTILIGEAEVGQSARSVGWAKWGPFVEWDGLHINRGFITLKKDGFVGFNGGCRPGMSGGALIDDSGSLVGIASFWYPGCDSFGYFVGGQYLGLTIERIPADK